MKKTSYFVLTALVISFSLAVGSFFNQQVFYEVVVVLRIPISAINSNGFFVFFSDCLKGFKGQILSLLEDCDAEKSIRGSLE